MALNSTKIMELYNHYRNWIASGQSMRGFCEKNKINLDELAYFASRKNCMCTNEQAYLELKHIYDNELDSLPRGGFAFERWIKKNPDCGFNKIRLKNFSAHMNLVKELMRLGVPEHEVFDKHWFLLKNNEEKIKFHPVALEQPKPDIMKPAHKAQDIEISVNHVKVIVAPEFESQKIAQLITFIRNL